LLDPVSQHFLPNFKEASAAQQHLEAALKAEEDAQRRAAELEATLARYRQQFGELPK
jgi:hypothetical protein